MSNDAIQAPKHDVSFEMYVSLLTKEAQLRHVFTSSLEAAAAVLDGIQPVATRITNDRPTIRAAAA